MDRARICLVGARPESDLMSWVAAAGLQVHATVPSPHGAGAELLGQYDLVMVVVRDADLVNEEWKAAMQRVATIRPILAVCGASDIERTSVVMDGVGASGCIAAGVAPSALRRTALAVAGGDAGWPRSAVAAILRGGHVQARRVRGHHGLTPRQFEVAEMIARGATDREIAAALHITESTAHKHVQNALRRAGARTRSHLVARMGLLAAT